MNITEKIHKLRAEKAWSVAKLARETDIPTVSLRVMLSRSDSNNYNVKALLKIAKALDTTVSYLTKDEDEDSIPELTKTQRKELQKVITDAIENYFSGGYLSKSD